MPRWGSLESRLLAKVNKDNFVPYNPELGPCWPWIGATASGYGVISFQGRQTGAHRVSYILFRGEIPEKMDIDHLCHPGDGSCPRITCPHRLCVNPDHLTPATRRENLARGNTFVARQLEVTHCPKGHEYTPENTRVRITLSGNKMRSCRQCDRNAHPPTGKINPIIAANAAKTHCPRGHEYSSENTIIDYSVGGKRGGRRCKTCRNEQQRVKYQANKRSAQLQ